MYLSKDTKAEIFAKHGGKAENTKKTRKTKKTEKSEENNKYPEAHCTEKSGRIPC